MNIAVRVRLARSTDWSSSTGAPCSARTAATSATVLAPTPAAAGWWLTIRALRALRQIRVLNTRVATGLVIGMSPSTTPIGLAISVTPRSSGGRGPIPGRPCKARFTSRLAKRFLKVLSATLPIPVLATVAAASSPAWPAAASAMAPSSASTRVSGQVASTAWAATARATAASTAGSMSAAKTYSSRWRRVSLALAAASRPSARSTASPVGGSSRHSRPRLASDRARAVTSVWA